MQILFEDNHLLAINKPNNILVQPDKNNSESLEDLGKAYIKGKYGKGGAVFLQAAHRIDQPVSGAVLFARTSKALERINAMFQAQQISKTYLAIVKNRPPQDAGRLEHYLLRKEKQNKTYAYAKPVAEAKHSILDYTLIASSDNYFLLKINLITGRHHQIRAQLSAISCPIKGDLKYGAERSNPGGGISLHSYQIGFEHPVKKEPVLITAALPNDALWTALAKSAGLLAR